VSAGEDEIRAPRSGRWTGDTYKAGEDRGCRAREHRGVRTSWSCQYGELYAEVNVDEAGTWPRGWGQDRDDRAAAFPDKSWQERSSSRDRRRRRRPARARTSQVRITLEQQEELRFRPRHELFAPRFRTRQADASPTLRAGGKPCAMRRSDDVNKKSTRQACSSRTRQGTEAGCRDRRRGTTLTRVGIGKRRRFGGPGSSTVRPRSALPCHD